MKKVLRSLFYAAGLAVIISVCSGCASKGYDSVIVTSNYVKSRLLAELIQTRTKQPIILLPTGSERETLYAMNTDSGREFPKPRFTNIVEHISPRTVIFLGDERFAPREYRDKVSTLYPTVVIEHADFDQVAEAAGAVMDLRSLAKDYHKMIRQIDSQGKVKPNPRSLWEDLGPAALEDGTVPGKKGNGTTPPSPIRSMPGGKK